MKKSVDERKRQFVEKMCIAFEMIGLPLMAGRIFAWLLICDPPYLSAEELAKLTGGSLGSISTQTRFLQGTKIIERVAIPGERKKYWRFSNGGWSTIMRVRSQVMQPFVDIADEGLEELSDQPESTLDRIKEMRDFYAFMIEEFPAMLDRWEEQKSRKESWHGR